MSTSSKSYINELNGWNNKIYFIFVFSYTYKRNKIICSESEKVIELNKTRNTLKLCYVCILTYKLIKKFFRKYVYYKDGWDDIFLPSPILLLFHIKLSFTWLWLKYFLSQFCERQHFTFTLDKIQKTQISATYLFILKLYKLLYSREEEKNLRWWIYEIFLKWIF